MGYCLYYFLSEDGVNINIEFVAWWCYEIDHSHVRTNLGLKSHDLYACVVVRIELRASGPLPLSCSLDLLHICLMIGFHEDTQAGSLFGIVQHQPSE